MRKIKTATINGETKTILEWAEEFDVSVNYIYKLAKTGKLEERVGKGFRPRKKSAPAVGARIGRLTVVDVGCNTIRVKCDCGTEKTILRQQFGKSLSCGCYQKEKVSQCNTSDLTGKRFGNVTILKRVGSNKYNYALWEVEDDCGTRAVVSSQVLKSGYTGKYLGYFEVPDTPLGRTFYKTMRVHKEFKSWREFENWAIKHGYREGLFIRKKDASKPYIKDNVYFGSAHGTDITIDGEVRNLAQWAEVLGISRERARQLHLKGKLEERVRRAKSTTRP